ncbi:CheR family methyltransferase [Noviherbaspirillum aridicola]|uniref:Chemotaxis protein CheR n=1 Tax=Noviherbaspirillum aridicola TaxID=2849687 RepID=A0ABQ4Q0F8_9BURK|nr:CheR family methyltransferase [Noviherbaspirillum aridicola]GIZ50624.1 chemotaxis protein CheR [Noviherbaspirillum aridicola]
MTGTPSGAVPQTVEALEIDLLLEAIFRCYGHDFRGYRREVLKRRLQPLIRDEGLDGLSALQGRVLHDPACSARVIRALTQRPASLFDDPEYFRQLREVMTPWLRSCPSPRVWLAECGTAEDACALAILLAEEGLHEKTHIFATAEDEGLLRDASSGRFAAGRLAEYVYNYRAAGGKRELSDYFGRDAGGPLFSEALRSNITWAQYSLATDASFNEFQMIVCRRALRDFGGHLRRRTLQLFYESMPLFGILSVDERDDMQAAPFVQRYKPVAEACGLYRRIA